jgi:glutathione S-transferase
MVCEEKQVPYDLTIAAPQSPESHAIHPLGKIPSMRHGEVALFESKAIATYIDRAFPGPRLISDDAFGTAEVEQWVSCVNTTVNPLLIRNYILAHLIPTGADGQPDRTVIDRLLPAMRTQIGALDKAVSKTGYLAGQGFTLTDINLMPVLYFVQRFSEGAEMVWSAGALADYFARHAERPSYKATIPPPHTPEVVARICAAAAAREPVA